MSTTTTEKDMSRDSHMHFYATTNNNEEQNDDLNQNNVVTDDDDDSDLDDEDQQHHYNYGEDKREFTERCWCWRSRGSRWRRWWPTGKVLDPRSKWVQEWNRVFLLVCATGLFVDPLFFYVLSVSDTCMCLFVDGWFAVTVTVLRCMTDALQVWNMWLQLKMAKRTFGLGASAAGGGGGGSSRGGLRDTNPGSVAVGYLKAKAGFFFDIFVILPIPQLFA